MYFPKYIMLVYIPTQSISEKKEQGQKFKKKNIIAIFDH